ncbi:MAG: NYN domain-containing protein [Elusimicrobia bacterium]|nr:NYN domain-containing protein [Elusimicrobiota bacterium]
MRKISSKPTVYLIDGSNFSRSSWAAQEGVNSDALEAEFLHWLGEVARTEPLKASCFRVVFDGGFRSTGGSAGPSINVYFSDEGKADDILLERAYFLSMEGTRAVIVTSDSGIRDKAALDGIKSLPCDSFFRLCENELKKGDR